MYFVAVIGSGPSGLFAVSACGGLGLADAARGGVLLLDASGAGAAGGGVGGQCSALYPEKPVYGVPGFVNSTAQSLVDALFAQASAYAPTVVLDALVSSVKPLAGDALVNSEPLAGDALASSVEPLAENNSVKPLAENAGFEITAGDRVFSARYVILATGAGRLHPNKLAVNNVDAFERNHIHYCIKDPQRFAGKHVVIAGGGDAAVDWALELLPIAASVSVVHRRAAFRAKNEAVLANAEEAKRLTIYRNAQITELLGEGETLRAVRVRNLATSNLVTSNLVTSNLVTSNLVTSNLVTSNLVTSNLVTSNLVTSDSVTNSVPSDSVTNLVGSDSVTSDSVPRDSVAEEAKTLDIKADELLVFFGLSTAACDDWNVATQCGKILVDPLTCETSVPGLYAIGDAVWRPNKIYMITLGFTDALVATHAIKRSAA
ncbi:MAG: NAD(P)/FAD-dependent oxidoreductase [Holosporales bacterium]|jgi:thioredoxin reductase|nr:NAD(P)/FAD-dependent oxidoreductase [Holosporales bacterium]